MAKRKVQDDVEVKQEENVENQPKENEEDPKTNLSIDDMVAQLKNDLIFSSVPSPVIPNVSESPKPSSHRRRSRDIVDLEGNPISIKGRVNSSSIVVGRGV